MMRNSINFTRHFSFAPPGATFNSEFMVNVGYSTAYNYNMNAYSFSRNNYDFSLPNLFRELGYTANAFHMNTSEYYSRAVNYRAFGYNNYFGLRDQDIYNNREYWLDRELIENKVFYHHIFQEQSLSYIITYTAHMPFKTSRGTCPMLTDEVGLSEFECASIQAAETDNFMGLLLKGLEENDMLDNTVIVAFADHYLYTFEDKSLPEKLGKDTRGNLINHTPFFIWSNGLERRTIRHVTSQLDILPTILNLFGIPHYPNYYIGRDALDPNFEPLVFFPDGSWWDGSTYVANGEYQFGTRMSLERIDRRNTMVRRRMALNDAVIKADYFRHIQRNEKD
jgi:phosphoglycerol transferase MdoB-like AlkP superfamily enzyme